MPSIDPKRSMRPYRKVDMGKELDSHEDRLKKLERLEGQLRLLQGVAIAAVLFIGNAVLDDCRAKDQKRVDDAGLKVKLESHLKEPHNVCEAGLETMNVALEDHGERLRTVEERLRIKRR